jgi:hypothetical protein
MIRLRVNANGKTRKKQLLIGGNCFYFLFDILVFTPRQTPRSNPSATRVFPTLSESEVNESQEVRRHPRSRTR